MNLGSSIRKGTAWVFSSRMINKTVKFMVGIALARILVPEDFGLLVTIQVFTGAAGFIAGGGMGQALVQAEVVEKRHFQVVFTLQLIICCLIYTFFFFIAPWIAIWLNNPIYETLLQINALNFIIRPFVNISRAKLRREMRFKALAFNSIVTISIGSTVSIVLALHDYRVWSLIYGGLASALYGAISITLISKCYPGIHFDKAIAKRLGGYGIKVSVNDIIFYLRHQVPNFLMGKYLGPGFVGLFNKGNSLAALPLETVAGSAYETIFRALSLSQKNLDQCKYIYLRTITLVSVYTLPFYIGIFWIAESFILAVYGEKWQLSAIPLQTLAIAGMLRCISNPSGAVMAAQNRLGTEVFIQFSAFLLAIAGCIYGIQQGSLAIISMSLLPAYGFLSLFLAFFALRILGANFLELFVALRPAILLNLILALCLYLSDWLLNYYAIADLSLKYLLIQSAIGGLIYASLFLYFPIRVLEKEALRWKQRLRLPRRGVISEI